MKELYHLAIQFGYDYDGYDVFFFGFEVQVASRASHTACHDREFAGPWLIYIAYFFYSNRTLNSS